MMENEEDEIGSNEGNTVLDGVITKLEMDSSKQIPRLKYFFNTYS